MNADKNRFNITILVMLMVTQLGFGQKEFNNWHFGSGVTFDFNSGDPVVGTNSSISVNEGSASVSDCEGNLMFYTDGSTVWNKLNAVMPNGTGLDGGSSSMLGVPPSQGALIVKRPETSGIFYIFTASSSKGLKYSIVNMTLNGGLGDVLVKNIVLDTTRTEKLAVTYHSNLKDIWVVTHYDKTNQYDSFLMTKDGVALNGVSSFDGDNHEDSHGDLKISRDGSKIGCVVDFKGRIYLGDFNNTTGVISNTTSAGGYSNPHGVEFSPDNSKMYINSTTSGIIQFPLAGTNTQTLSNSITIGPSTDVYGSLQLGPNDKIYVTNANSSYIGIISEPNAYGDAASFTKDALYVGGSRAGYELTNVTLTSKTSINGPNSVQYNNACSADLIIFTLGIETDIIDVLWVFGDTASVLNNYSVELSPEHQYSGVGLYNGKVDINYSCGSETINFSVDISEATIGNQDSCNTDSSLLYTEKNTFPISIKIYPNPATFKIDYEIYMEDNIKQSISITDVAGNVVFIKNIRNKRGRFDGSISCDTFSRGIYFLKVHDGKTISTTKIILQ